MLLVCAISNRFDISIALWYNTTMAQDYDNMGKSLWRDHAADLSTVVSCSTRDANP